MNADVGREKRRWRSGGGGQVHVSVIARSKWEARKIRDEYRRKTIGGGEVNVKGNAINGFVRSPPTERWMDTDKRTNE